MSESINCKRKIAKWVLRFILTSLAFLFWGLSIYGSDCMTAGFEATSVRFEGEGVTKEELNKALANEQKKNMEIPEITAWNEVKHVALQNEALGFLVSSVLYEVYGDCNKVYPLELIDGAFPAVGDFYGCVIDETAAYTLYGTVYAADNTLICRGASYIVRGVVKSKTPVVILQAAKENTRFRNLEISYSDKEWGAELTENFLHQNGFYNNNVLLEGGFYAKVTAELIKLPLWILFIYQTVCLIKVGKRFMQVHRFISFFFAGCSIVFFLFLSGLRFYWPQRLLPSRWSDFEFWKRQWSEFQGLLNRFLYLQPFPRDILLITTIRKTLICTFLTVLCMGILISHQRVIKRWFVLGNKEAGLLMKRLAGMTAFILASALSAVLILWSQDIFFSIPSYFPLALVVFFVFLCLIKEEQAYDNLSFH